MSNDNGMDVMPSWQELKAERDALAAHVERFESTITEVGEDCAQFGNIQDGTWNKIDAALESSPATSLARLKAEWQAEALDEVASLVERTGILANFGTLRMKAKELRRKAEESK